MNVTYRKKKKKTKKQYSSPFATYSYRIHHQLLSNDWVHDSFICSRARKLIEYKKIHTYNVIIPG